jgi:CheY-like chemotaxis protein
VCSRVWLRGMKAGPIVALNGLRILVVEDELLAVMTLEDLLHDAGCVIIATVSRVGPALEVVREAEIDIALLDVNLAGERVYPVAEVLAVRRVPFLFMTGYSREMLPASYASRPVVTKPFTSAELIDGISGALGNDGQRRASA